MNTEKKFFALSEHRYTASASERRVWGGKTVTQFLVGVEGSDPSTWKRFMGYGPTPGERKTYALNAYKRWLANEEAKAPTSQS